jgi:Putative MetA-pathway of phenol degradation
MTTVVNKLLAASAGAVALCAAAVAPASAGTWTQPGATDGAPIGALPPPGLYFVGNVNWGQGSPNPTTAVGVGVQAFVWNPGWTFLGASYAMSAAMIEVEAGVHGTGAAGSAYTRGVYNPNITPISLSWNLGNGFFLGVYESIYLPLTEPFNVAVPYTTSGADFESRIGLSYVTSEWIASANVYGGVTTTGADGTRTPDYLNVDLTLLKEFGKWRLGPVAYGSWDLQTTSQNVGVGKGVALGVGGVVGYNFGPVDFSVMLTHQVDTHGDTNYGKDDTRAWATIVIPIWNPTAPAPKPLVAKY